MSFRVVYNIAKCDNQNASNPDVAKVRLMRIITERKIQEFWEAHLAAESAMRQWIATVREADWHNFADVRATFNHADIYKRCTIFDVGGNKYRIIAMIEYQKHLVFIRQVLTHVEYDKNKWQPDCG